MLQCLHRASKSPRSATAAQCRKIRRGSTVLGIVGVDLESAWSSQIDVEIMAAGYLGLTWFGSVRGDDLPQCLHTACIVGVCMWYFYAAPQGDRKLWQK